MTVRREKRVHARLENLPGEIGKTVFPGFPVDIVKSVRIQESLDETEDGFRIAEQGDGSGGSFLGAKFSYISEEENTFMGFGGMRYMEVNYTDAEWADYVAANNNDLSAEYKKSE